MGETSSLPAGRNRIAGRFLRNAYWCFFIAILLAIIVYQATWRRRLDLRPTLAVATPAYAQVNVTIRTGEYRMQALLEDLAAQSHVEIVTLWLPPNDETVLKRDTKVSLESHTCSLEDMLNELAAATKLVVDYEDARIVAGNGKLVHSANRCTIVTYPVGDLLMISDPVASGGTREERMNSIGDLIRSEVAPEEWRDNGGIIASIAKLDDKLVITATPAMHRKIVGIFRAIRER